MALLQRNFTKMQYLGLNLIRRGLNKVASNTNEIDVKKSVFISQSTDIYTNLALENWIYNNFDLQKHHVLLFYYNESSVLIGKNQNPWVEVNVSALTDITDNGTQLVRRFGGGSAIYNDKGVLNMTFFAPRNRYNHNYNLEIISRALFRKFNVKADISSVNNLSVHNIDMSSISSKIGAQNSYLNCSVLIDANKINLMDALFRDEDNVSSKAVASKKTRYLNLNEVDPSINVENVLSAVGWEYLRTSPFCLKDGGMELANKQKGFQMINPTDGWFTGLSSIRASLTKWNWCYGATPEFSISRNYQISTSNSQALDSYIKVTLNIRNGIIDDVILFIPPDMSISRFSGEAKVITGLKGRKYADNLLDSIEKHLTLSHVDNTTEKQNDCVRHAVLSV